MRIDTKEDWWKSVNENKGSIIKIVERFTKSNSPTGLSWGAEINALIEMKDWGRLVSIMNNAW